MEINPEQFGGFNFHELNREMIKGNTVETSFGLIFKPVEGYIFLKYRSDESGKRPPVDVEFFKRDEAGLKQAVITGFEALRDYEAVDGFQVENEFADTYGFESFEVVNLELAVEALVDARKEFPEEEWFINIIGKGDVEEAEFVVGIAKFDLKDAPI